MSCLGIRHPHQSDVGQLAVAPVIHLNGDHVVLPVAYLQLFHERLLLVEVAQEESCAASFLHPCQSLHRLCDVCPGAFRVEVEQCAYDIQNVLASFLRRYEFLDMVRENKELRIEVEQGIERANTAMSVARCVMSDKSIDVALMLPRQEMSLEVSEKNVMSVMIPVFDVKFKTADENDIYSYGFAETSGDLDDAVKALSDIMPKLIRLAELEKSCRLLADEIEKTRRRVNALEHVMIPQYEETIKFIAMKLDENERSTTTRLMKVKDMMLAQAHHYE